MFLQKMLSILCGPFVVIFVSEFCVKYSFMCLFLDPLVHFLFIIEFILV